MCIVCVYMYVEYMYIIAYKLFIYTKIYLYIIIYHIFLIYPQIMKPNHPMEHKLFR